MSSFSPVLFVYQPSWSPIPPTLRFALFTKSRAFWLAIVIVPAAAAPDGPRLTKRGCLVVRTSWLGQVLTLGLVRRGVVINPQKRTVTVRRRYGWLFTRRAERIPFGAIRAVGYGYFPGVTTRGLFTIGLKLGGGQELGLFYEGNETESRLWVERISEMIGVPVEPPA